MIFRGFSYATDHQESAFDSTRVTTPPIIKKKRSLKEEIEVTDTNKRPRISAGDPSEYISNFYQTLRNVLNSQISSVINNKKLNEKRREDSLINLKDKGLKDIRFPRCVLTNAVDLSHCRPSFLSQYLDVNLPVRNYIAWNCFVEENFDEIKAFVRAIKTSVPVTTSSDNVPVPKPTQCWKLPSSLMLRPYPTYILLYQ